MTTTKTITKLNTDYRKLGYKVGKNRLRAGKTAWLQTRERK